MKKLLIATLALITALSISLAACSTDKDKDPVDEDPDDDLVAHSDDTTTPAGDDTTTGNNGGGASLSWETKNDTIYVLTACNLRASASKTSAKVGEATFGQSFQRTETNGKWSKITYNDATAYVLNDLITDSAQRATFVDKASENKILHIKADSQSNLRTSPVSSEEANNVKGIITDAHTAAGTLKLVALSQDGVWARVTFEGNLGTETNPNVCTGLETLYIHTGNIVEFAVGGGSQLPG